MEISPDFSTLGLVLTVPLIGYVLVEGLVGKTTYERMQRERGRDPRALVRMVKIWMALSWASTLMVLAVLAVSPGIAASDLGLAPPGDPSTTLGVLAGMALAMPLMVFFLYRGARKGRAVPSTAPDLHPKTSTERLYMVAMSVTAGVCEEIVYRGFLIAVGVGVLGLDLWWAAALALALFALGHVYQGWQGVLMVTAVGFALTRVYLMTGSLLLVVILHVVIDIFALVITPTLTGRASAKPAPAQS